MINRRYENDRKGILSGLTGFKRNEIKYFTTEKELLSVLEYIRNQYVRYTNHEKSDRDFLYTRRNGSMLFPCITLYCLVRAAKPEIIVETGGTPGKSSAAILAAIRKNSKGLLYTFDLPPKIAAQIGSTEIHKKRPESTKPYWAVPINFRGKHIYIYGDTKKTLKKHLEKIGKIDIFIHDSCHTYAHMYFEYEAAWPFIKSGGFLVSDDIFGNTAFQDFAKLKGKKWFSIANYGVMKK